MQEETKTVSTYTVDMAMRAMHLTRQTVLLYIKKGYLKAFRVGKQYRIFASSLEEFIAKRTV